MKDAKTAVVYDLDSTICDTRNRWHLSPLADPGSTWEAYSLACHTDLPMPATIRRMQLDWEHHQVHICSGRNAVARELTEKWLADNGCAWDSLRLRGDWTPGEQRTGDQWQSNSGLKAAYICSLQEAGTEVVLMYEDWPTVAGEIARLTSVPVLVINPCYDDTDFEGRAMKALRA